MNGLQYLATPYSKYPAGIQVAFENACQIAARLLTRGIKVYSPIAHTHPIAIHGGLNPYDHSIWLPFDQAIMECCSGLIIAHMEGWETSYGISEEIDFFWKEGKDIYDLEPTTLTIMKR
jgi:hypothetical protein